MTSQTSTQKKQARQAQANKFTTQTKDLFTSFNLRYTMQTFRYCSENEINLDELREFNFKNLALLLTLATPSIKLEEAEPHLNKWLENKYDLPLLHLYCLELAKASGFFMTENSLAVIGNLVEKDEDLLKLALPLVTKDIESQVNHIQSLSQSI